MALLLLLAAFWVCVLPWADRASRDLPRSRPQRVVVDDAGVRRELADGRVEYVAWRNLVGVDIVTTSGGPFADDFFVVLHGRDGRGCLVPLEHTEPLIPRLQALPGFDSMALIAASGSTGDARFVCWRAADAPAES